MTFRFDPAAFQRVPSHSVVVIRSLYVCALHKEISSLSVRLNLKPLNGNRQQTSKKRHQKNGPMLPIFLQNRRASDARLLQRVSRRTFQLSSPVSVLTRSAQSKHITSLSKPVKGGGRTLTSGQLQSSPAPFLQSAGEFLCQHTYRAHSNTY